MEKSTIKESVIMNIKIENEFFILNPLKGEGGCVESFRYDENNETVYYSELWRGNDAKHEYVVAQGEKARRLWYLLSVALPLQKQAIDGDEMYENREIFAKLAGQAREYTAKKNQNAGEIMRLDYEQAELELESRRLQLADVRKSLQDAAIQPFMSNKGRIV